MKTNVIKVAFPQEPTPIKLRGEMVSNVIDVRHIIRNRRIELEFLQKRLKEAEDLHQFYYTAWERTGCRWALHCTANYLDATLNIENKLAEMGRLL